MGQYLSRVIEGVCIDGDECLLLQERNLLSGHHKLDFVGVLVPLYIDQLILHRHLDPT